MKALRILYIDDDEGFTRLVSKHLGREGYVVETAADGHAGLGLLQAGGYDVVAVDHYMPGMDGLELVAEVGRMAAPPPVVYVTASEEGRVAVAALKAGAADYVIKTVSDEFFILLRRSLEQAVERAGLRREKERAEHEMRLARDKAEMLLREVNHRIANSLSLVASFVRLQASAAADGGARSVLTETQNRIQAVAHVHRSLYSLDDVNSVAMADYLKGLTGELQTSLESASAPHRIELDAAPVRMPTDKAVAAGVIVTELITNAFKYAYPAGVGGAIRVSLAQPETDRLLLSVEDDGIGYVQGRSARGTGLGARIVSAMATTLQATQTCDTGDSGTRTALLFAAD